MKCFEILLWLGKENIMYKMKCPRCDCEMKYMQDSVIESRGYIVMDCENCKEEYLVPSENPELREE
jgi:peptide subunit release factor 1 (eRF1)